MLAEHIVGLCEGLIGGWLPGSATKSLDYSGKYGHKYIMPTLIILDLAFRTIVQSTTRKSCMDN